MTSPQTCDSVGTMPSLSAGVGSAPRPVAIAVRCASVRLGRMRLRDAATWRWSQA
jgi:hypothetical protein